jgi:hypothetical protein
MHRSVYLLLLLIANIRAEEDATSVLLDEGKIIGGTDVPLGKYPWFAKASDGDRWEGELVLYQKLTP